MCGCGIIAATQRNVATLKKDGVLFVGPNDGEMACGEFGPGRMSEPTEIANAIEQALVSSANGPLAGFKALVTAGPTQEPLDPVRFIANHSSGKQGYAIAERAGAMRARTPRSYRVPSSSRPPSNVKLLQDHDRARDAERERIFASRRCGGVHGGGGRLAARCAGQQQDQEDRPTAWHRQ
jgi:phosphopantothenoylcysteine synthetase/decarboxylase